MKIDAETLERSEKRAPLVAPSPVREAQPRAARAATEAIERRAGTLSFAGFRPTNTEYERMMGANDLVDEFYLERALAAAKPVCRVVLRSASGRETGWATGFLVSPRLMLTNWHVFRRPEEAGNALAEFEYKFDIRGNPAPSVRFLVRPERFYHSNRDLDYAVVAVEESSLDNGAPLRQFGYHRPIPMPGKILDREWITIIQHPGGQRRQFAIRENELLGRDEHFLWYKSDTAQGSSGAPAFNDSFQVVALHHSGKAKKENGLYVLRSGQKVAALAGVDDADVVWEKNEGVRVSVMCADMERRLDPANPYVAELRHAMESDEGHVMALARGGAPPEELQPHGGTAVPAQPRPGCVQPDGAGLVIPLQLQVSLAFGTGAQPAIPPVEKKREEPILPPPPSEEAEKLIPPPVDRDYSNRSGYDPDFLGHTVPLPEITDLPAAAKLEDGGHVVPYEHFSLVLHKRRRLAIFTASNVDGRAAKRQPEPGLYTRKALFGITGKNGRESWLPDPRLRLEHQLPEVFYDKDGGAFDKGHIVRREDVCWGSSREQIVKANADSYHVTNCSPQVAGYNQAMKEGLWGLLEDTVLEQVKAQQKFTVFAGPVLAADDKVFDGRDSVGVVRVQIPRRFWKIVVAEKEGALQAFAFVLEQDLNTVPLENEEFQVTGEWTPYLVPIQELEDELGIVKFPQALKEADGAESLGGEEMLRAGKVKRKPRVGTAGEAA